MPGVFVAGVFSQVFFLKCFVSVFLLPSPKLEVCVSHWYGLLQSILRSLGDPFWLPRGPLRHHFAAPGLPLGPLGSFLALGSNFETIAGQKLPKK